MRNFIGFVVSRLITGVIVVAPIYLTVLLLLKAAQSLLSIMQPVAALLPESVPAEELHSVADDPVFLFLDRTRDEDSERTGNMGANGKFPIRETTGLRSL